MKPDQLQAAAQQEIIDDFIREYGWNGEGGVYVRADNLPKLVAALRSAPAGPPSLRLEGHATDMVWTMCHSGEIGLRLDDGDSGMVLMTIDQAESVIDALQSSIRVLAGEPPSAAGRHITLAPPIDPTLTDYEVFGGPIENEAE